MLLRSILRGVFTIQCPPFQVRFLLGPDALQGRQDLNLQPAVLETAALPVELRPFAGWQANLPVSGFTHERRSSASLSLCIVTSPKRALFPPSK
jgi:hypothetical protein